LKTAKTEVGMDGTNQQNKPVDYTQENIYFLFVDSERGGRVNFQSSCTFISH